MFHSIIIPHRKRNLHLMICIEAIERSAAECGADVKDYEILVVDNGSAVWPPTRRAVRVVLDGSEMPVFNKPILLNHGVAEAQGDVLSFLDADSIVGRQWMACPQLLFDDPLLTKICYRVRKAPEHRLIPLKLAEQTFGQYEQQAWGFEARVRPEDNHTEGEPLFGNSQFSIRRDVLGDLRWNEAFVGGAYEDIWMNRELWRRQGEHYKVFMPPEPERSILQVQHERKDQGEDWCTDKIIEANANLYFNS